MYAKSLQIFIHVLAGNKQTKKTKACKCHVGVSKIISAEFPLFPIGFSSGNHGKYYTVVLVPLGGAAFIVFLSESL